ncbi:MAG TPA: aminopeptidase, partial [Saprospiraceae bacterium]|nr:aminopeptidase [Saprospiraceae bacterium]
MVSIHQKYAQLLVNYCLSVQPNQKVYIVSTYLAEPLIKEVYKEILRIGAFPEIKIILPEENKIFIDLAQEHQLDYVSPITQLIYESFDAYLYIRAPYNLREDQNIDRSKSARKSKANTILNTTFSERTATGSLKRCICQYPTFAGAQEAGLSLEEYEHFIYNSCKLFDDNPTQSWQSLG